MFWIMIMCDNGENNSKCHCTRLSSGMILHLQLSSAIWKEEFPMATAIVYWNWQRLQILFNAVPIPKGQRKWFGKLYLNLWAYSSKPRGLLKQEVCWIGDSQGLGSLDIKILGLYDSQIKNECKYTSATKHKIFTSGDSTLVYKCSFYLRRSLKV